MRRIATILALLGALALPASAQADLPWWTLEAGSRPSNLQVAPDQTEVQEVRSEKAELPFPLGTVLISPIAVGGKAVGCLGVGEFFFQSAEQICEEKTGFKATETPAALAELLEGLYGGEVQLAGPAGFGEGPITLTTPGRWVPRLELGPRVRVPNPFEPSLSIALGEASSQVSSQASGRLAITATNVGDASLDATSNPLRVSDELPEGVSVYGVEGFAGLVMGDTVNGGSIGIAGPVDCEIDETGGLAGGELIECAFEGELPPYEAIELELAVALTPAALDGATGQVKISGGDAQPKSATQTLHVSGDAVRFGIEGFAMGAEEEGGATSSQAGSHPFQVTQSLVFNAGKVSGSDRANTVVEQPAQLRNVNVKLPPGLVGNPSPIPTCSFKQFTTQGVTTPPLIDECPPESAVGAASVTIIEPGAGLEFTRVAVPLFNLEPVYGEPARLGFMVAGVPVTIDTELRSGEAYAIGAEVHDVSQLATVISSTVSVWGNPGDPAHDSTRGWGCLYWNHPYPCQRPSGETQKSFLRMPVSCSEPVRFGIDVEPWNVPPGSEISSASDESPPLTGCDLLPFDPQVESTPTTKLASNPSGLDFSLKMPNSGLENPEGRSEAQPRKLEVALPPGMTANASLAEGLTTCSEAQLKGETASSGPGEGCPEASKIGTVELETPLLQGRLLQGSVFVATPYQNPVGSLIALYLTIREPQAGVIVTQTLQVKPDPATGQLVTVAEGIPQLPFSELRVHLRSGGRPPLISGPLCGSAQTKATFYPYSAPAPVIKTSDAQIVGGPEGGSCPGSPPFHPGFEAGSQSAAAGHYSPFYMRLTRKDGEADMGKFSFVLPPGVVPKLAGIPYCSEADIARAMSRQGPHGGAEERSDPSCPAASQIGRTLAGAGAGSDLTYVPGKLYLAGPYHGDPISAVAITPAVAGPFDVGTVVVREALRLNPVTHVGEVDGQASDPIPHILKGIPLTLRDLRVYADRPEFTLTPTSCERFEARASIWGSYLDSAGHASPETEVGLASPYQAVNCSLLPFKPKLALKLKGGTKRGKFPALHAVYTPRPGDANLSRLALRFPTSEFIEQGHFGTICTRVQFAAGAGNGSGCPPASVYGRVTAYSPLLAEPLSGPVYLRSSDHNLPDAVFALHGLVDIDVVVRIDSSGGGLRATVEGAPDAPVSKAIVDMQGGRKGLFVNSTDLCRGKHRADAKATGQNGRVDSTKPLVRARCGKAHGKRHKVHHRRGRR